VGIGLAAVTKLLPALLDSQRRLNFTHLRNRDPSAVALWIQGERRYRNADFSAALDLYQRAVAEDSAFAFAALQGAQAASWRRWFDVAERLVGVALGHDSLLPPKYKHFAHGLNNYLTGQADSAVSQLRSALSLDPDWGEAWNALGEVYFHLLPSDGPLDSLAESSLRRALLLDTAFTVPLVHLTELALRRRNVRGADSLMQSLSRPDVDTTTVRRLSLMRDCVTEGAAGISWMSLAQNNPEAVLMAARGLSVGGAELECAAAGFRATIATTESDNFRWGALLGLHNVMIARGDTSRALALLDSAFAAGESSVLWLYVLNPVAGAGMESKGEMVEGLSRQWFGDDYERGSSRIRWLLAVWHAHKGDAEKVATLAASLRATADETRDQLDDFYARAVEGHLAVLRADTAGAIRKFAALQPVVRRDVLMWGLSETGAVERFKLAQLLMDRREYEDAYRVASAFVHPQPMAFLPYLQASLDLRMRAAESIGPRPAWLTQTRESLDRLAEWRRPTS
jgi:tetratricopeptide (TPR) repeat protein